MKSLAALVVLAHTAAAQPAALGKLQNYYAQQTQLTTDFTQTVKHASFGTTQTSSGRMWAAKPSSFRADYYQRGTTKVDKSFIYNGTTLWVINHQNKQVLQSPAQASAIPGALSFITGGASLTTQFNVALDPSGNLELTPKQPSAQYAKIVFVVAASGEVIESTVYDPNGDTNDFVFKNASTTAPVKASWFQFSPSSLPTYQVVTPPAAAHP